MGEGEEEGVGFAILSIGLGLINSAWAQTVTTQPVILCSNCNLHKKDYYTHSYRLSWPEGRGEKKNDKKLLKAIPWIPGNKIEFN